MKGHEREFCVTPAMIIATIVEKPFPPNNGRQQLFFTMQITT